MLVPIVLVQEEFEYNRSVKAIRGSLMLFGRSV